MAEPAIATDVHEPLDVHRDLGTQGALDLEVRLDLAAEATHILIGEGVGARGEVDSGGLQDPLGRTRPIP